MADPHPCIECVEPANCASWQCCERLRAFAPHKLITEVGEIDRLYLVTEARRRAIRDCGHNNPQPAWVRPHVLNLEEMAYFLRRDWRLAHGLKDDVQMVTGMQLVEPRRMWA